MIDLNACLESSHVTKIVGNDENKKDIYEKYIHSMKLLEQLDSLLIGIYYLY